MTDQLPPRRGGNSIARELEPRPTSPAPEDVSHLPRNVHGEPYLPRGGSDPTTPPTELDPDALAAMLPRSRWS